MQFQWHFRVVPGLTYKEGWKIGAVLGLGVGTSGYYVRKAKTPSLAELREFLASN